MKYFDHNFQILEFLLSNTNKSIPSKYRSQNTYVSTKRKRKTGIHKIHESRWSRIEMEIEEVQEAQGNLRNMMHWHILPIFIHPYLWNPYPLPWDVYQLIQILECNLHKQPYDVLCIPGSHLFDIVQVA